MSWKEKHNLLLTLVKDLSDRYNGDEEAWLKVYTQEIVTKYFNNLDLPISAFKELLR